MFQYILCVGSSLTCASYLALIAVSIHPMCRFKFRVFRPILIRLFRFNTSYVSVQVALVFIMVPPSTRFNTSYVSVQDDSKVFINCLLRVSIHPMCRFK